MCTRWCGPVNLVKNLKFSNWRVKFWYSVKLCLDTIFTRLNRILDLYPFTGPTIQGMNLQNTSEFTNDDSLLGLKTRLLFIKRVPYSLSLLSHPSKGPTPNGKEGGAGCFLVSIDMVVKGLTRGTLLLRMFQSFTILFLTPPPPQFWSYVWLIIQGIHFYSHEVLRL